MRTLVTVVAGAVVTVASAFASNIALSTMATVTASSSLTVAGITYGPNNALDWSSGSAWIAPGGVANPNPYLLISLDSPAEVDSITVNGGGNPGLFSAFDIFVGSLTPNLANFSTLSQSALISQLEGPGSFMTLVGSETDQPDGTQWADTFSVSTSSTIQYVLYLGISGSGGGCGGTCEPGVATFTASTPTAGQDDAFTTGIVVDAVPEPATFGLFGACALLLGFARRPRK